MKNTNWYKWLSIALGLALVYVIFHKAACGSKDVETVEVKTPVVTGVLVDTTHAPVVHTPVPAAKPYLVVVHDTIPVKDSVDIKILNDYIAAGNDSIKKLNVLIGAAKISKFYKDIEDKNLSLCISGTVQGEVKDVQAEYLIKSQSILVPVPVTYLRVLGGGEFGTNARFEKPVLKFNLDFQLKSGDVIGTAADNNGYYYLRYSKSFFNFKK